MRNTLFLFHFQLVLETMVLVVLVFVLVLVVLLVLVGAAGAGGGGGGSVGRMNFGTSFAPRSPTSFAPRHNCNKIRVLFFCIGLRATITLQSGAVINESTLLVALPCRLDKSSDNFEGSKYIVSVPRLHCKVQQKIKTEHCFSCFLPCRMDWSNQILQNLKNFGSSGVCV